MRNEKYIDHETRIRLMEELNKRIESKFYKLETKIDSHFMWLIGLVFVSIITPVVLHAMKLV